MSAAAKQKDARVFARAEHDFYAEPQGLADAVARFVVTDRRDAKHLTICDPCCGTGRIVRAFGQNYRRNVDYILASDLVPRWREWERLHGREAHQSTLKCDISWHVAAACDVLEGQHFDAVVTNPPYDRKLLWPIVAAARRAAPYVAMILPAAFWHSASAIPHCDGLSDVLSIIPRPSMPPGVVDHLATHTPDGVRIGGGAVDFCVAVWRFGRVGAPRGGWFNWGVKAENESTNLLEVRI